MEPRAHGEAGGARKAREHHARGRAGAERVETARSGPPPSPRRAAGSRAQWRARWGSSALSPETGSGARTSPYSRGPRVGVWAPVSSPPFLVSVGETRGAAVISGGRGVGAQRETVRRGRGIAAVRDRGDSGNRLIIAVRGVEVVLACSSDCAWAWAWQRLGEEGKGRGAAERRAGLCLSSCWGPSTTIFLLINKRRRSRPCRVRPISLIIYLL